MTKNARTLDAKGKKPPAQGPSVRIRLDRSELEECRRFSEECSKTQQAIEFGQADTASRSFAEIARDNMIGKLGEFAVQRFLDEHGIHVELDLDIYARGEWDACDVEWRGWTFDIKCTKSRSRWFLLEWNKLQFRADAQELPHCFILTRLVDDKVVNDLSCLPKFVEVDLVGYVDTRSLKEGAPGVETLPKGSLIPGTRTPLMAQSFGIEDRNLNHDWDGLIRTLKTKKPFSLADYEAPGIVMWDHGADSAKMAAPRPACGSRYSLLVSGSALPTPGELEDITAQGIKLYAFVSESRMNAYAHLQGRAASRIFSVHGRMPSLCLRDGADAHHHSETLETLAEAAPGFNLEQYFVEHAPVDGDIVVKASAGTGKTTVMIDRMIFLFATDDTLMPADVGMITFTNKATASMTEKLQERVRALYDLTGSARWFAVLERLADLQMSTIDSFFKNILRTEGGALGYGNTARQRSLAYEKRQLLLKILNDLFKNGFPSFSKRRDLFDNDCVDLAYDIWNKMRGLGFFRESVKAADFGTAEDEASNRLIAELVRQGDERYEELKHDLNAYAVDDLKAEVAALSQVNIQTLHRRPLRHVFVDEFQDTDNCQIRSLVWLKDLMKASVFVVGDVKQSIYRFRGAQESAFEEFQKRLRQSGCLPATEFVLMKNYRTVPNIIKKFNSVFGLFGSQQLLPWDGDAIACFKGTGEMHVRRAGRNDTVESVLQSLLPELNKDRRHVCMLVRDNRQVDTVAQICRSLNLRCHAKRRGGFYQTPAVLDFQCLIEALLYPQDARKLWNLMMTPYVSRRPDPDVIAGFNGNQESVVRYLTKLLDEDGWSGMRAALRSRPFFAELNRILTRLNPIGRLEAELSSRGLDEEDCCEQLEHYKLNLNKLLSGLYEQFSGEFASIFEVCEYLRIQTATNRKEDELYPDIKSGANCIFEVMTVHKAKGLEFETVVLPFTGKPFLYESDSARSRRFTIREDESSIRVGWKIKKQCNSIYAEDVDFEKDAVRRDETRLLYVAMTRAKEDLYVIQPYRIKSDTWASLLSRATGALS